MLAESRNISVSELAFVLSVILMLLIAIDIIAVKKI